MNVLNRKMFRNNDARRALSEMGGIVSFVNGGNSEPVQMYVINVPGFTQPGEYLKIREDTLMLLNDTIPHLMSLRDTMVEPAEDLGGYVNVKPGDAIVRTRLSNRPGMTTIEDASVLESGTSLLPPEPKPVKAESFLDRIRANAREVNPLENALQNVPISSNVLGESADALMSVIAENAEMPLPDAFAMDASTQRMTDAELANAALARTGDSSRFTRSELDDILNPTMGDALPSSTVEESALEKILKQVAGDGRGTTYDNFVGGDSIEEYKRLASEDKTIPQDLQNDLAEAQNNLVDREEDFAENPTGEKLTAVVDAKEKVAAAENIIEDVKKFVSVKDKDVFALEGPEAAGPVLTEYTKAVEKVYNAATEEDLKAGEEALRKTLELKMRPERGTDRYSLLQTATKKDDTEPEKKSTPASDKDRLEAKYQELADLFGIKPEKKADMYELMAMIGFAMAAGESPSALKNIADAFLIGAQIRREDAKEDEAFDQKLKLLAFEYLQDEKTALRASQQELAKEQRREDRETRKMQLDFMLRANLEEIKSKLARGDSLRSAVRDVLTASIGVTGQLPTSEMVNDAMLLMGPLFGENQLISTDNITGGNNERKAMESQLFGG